MRTTLVMLAACGGGWQPRVVATVDDAAAKPVAVEFADGANGTQVVLAVLGQAKAGEVGAISDFEIQVGRCTRAILPVAGGAVAASPDTELIVARLRESTYSCKHVIEQVRSPGGGGGLDGPKKLGDADMVERDQCDRGEVDHVVARYRFELDHHFVPPDWTEIARAARVRLAYGPPHCGGEARNEIRARFHRAKAAVSPTSPMVASPDAIIALVKRAQAAAAAKRPGEAVELAQQALAAFGDGAVLATLDDAHANELAGWIAAAQFFAVEIDVDKFLRREQPASIEAVWADAVGAEIDRIAKRYERIKDLVRLPAVVPWLRAGAARLATLHEHVADLLDAAGQAKAADTERARAKALVATSQGN